MAVVVGPSPEPAGSSQLVTHPSEATPLITSSKPDSENNGAATLSDPPLTPVPLVRKLSNYIQNSRVVREMSAESVRNFVPLGIITLEDVIEELIQEEIIDETDVFVDMRRKIKVMRAVKQAQLITAAVDIDGQQQGKRRGMAFSSRRRND
ncbi:hypothetical protein BX070DRAFT_227241 [Coemansia spiralis]|nr:hypothetical protein BX070DRAFT_227241 [Coemansia spiralis]